MEVNSNMNSDREQLRQFIASYRNLPILWDTKCPNYSKKDKRYEAYEKLVHVYRTIKYDATIMDVKKKINSMRSNFRKEMKKVEESAAIGIQHRPSSWMYDELIFLNDSEICFPCANSSSRASTVFISDADDSGNDNDVSHNYENDIPVSHHHQYSVKRPKYSESNDNSNTYTQFSDKKTVKNYAGSGNGDSSTRNVINPSISYNDDLAKVWAAKLKHLAPLQRLFAEKAINDVLFEAQLGTLHRSSVNINIVDRANTIFNNDDEIRMSEPSQSSPEYKFSQTYGFTEDVHKTCLGGTYLYQSTNIKK